MKFKAVDEIFNFDFQDALASKFKLNDDGISMELEGLIVEPENSQNENYVKSYADKVNVRFLDGKILGGLKDGYRRYDANDKLIEDVDDISMDSEEIKILLKSAGSFYLYGMNYNKDSKEGSYIYSLLIEFPSKEEYSSSNLTSYEVKISFKSAIFEWDKYLNRV